MYNGHGDVTALLKTDGTIAATYYYDAFGNKVGEGTNENGINNPFRYAGYQFGGETGLYYLNSRYYDSKIARFITEDTYTGDRNDPLSLNLYTYCINNPIAYWDPTGHSPQNSVVDYLNSKGQNSSYSARKELAKDLGISNYTGTAAQNTQLLNKLQSQNSSKSSSVTVTNYNTSTNQFTLSNGKTVSANELSAALSQPSSSSASSKTNSVQKPQTPAPVASKPSNLPSSNTTSKNTTTSNNKTSIGQKVGNVVTTVKDGVQGFSAGVGSTIPGMTYTVQTIQYYTRGDYTDFEARAQSNASYGFGYSLGQTIGSAAGLIENPYGTVVNGIKTLVTNTGEVVTTVGSTFSGVANAIGSAVSYITGGGSSGGGSKTIKNSAGQEVERKLVNNQDELLEEAEKAAGGSLDDFDNYKPGWWLSKNGKTKIEWEPGGHSNTNEGPHVTVREKTPDGKWKVVDKIFIKGQETYK